MASITGAQTGLKEIFPGMGIKGGASKGKVKTKTKDKTYVKEQRNISGQKAEVSYTKSRWKSWKKSKKDQFKRKENYLKTLSSLRREFSYLYQQVELRVLIEL